MENGLIEIVVCIVGVKRAVIAPETKWDVTLSRSTRDREVSFVIDSSSCYGITVKHCESNVREREREILRT